MGLGQEVRSYMKSTVHPEEIIFDAPGDEAAYHRHHAWDSLATHFFQPARPTSGGGNPTRVRLVFKSSEAADAGLKILNELKKPVK